MAITREQLLHIMPTATGRAGIYLAPLNAAMDEFGINTPLRMAAFLAQVAHESGELRYVRELASGKAYEGRQDLGNNQPGDGERFRGRGLIQLTGRHNYQEASQALGVDFVSQPERLEMPTNACRSAAWYWNAHNLNKWADAGDFDGVSDVINRGRKTAAVGDANGYADRLKYYERAKAVLMPDAQPEVQEVNDFFNRITPPSQPEPERTPATAPVAQGGKPMAPFIAAAIPALLEAAPDLIRAFGKEGGKVTERNASVAEKVVEIAKNVTGESTAEGAVNAIQSDPELAAKFREQAYQQRLELVDLSEKSIGSARTFYQGEPPILQGAWGQIKFHHILAILVVAAALSACGYVLGTSADPGERTMALQAMLLTGFGTVMYFFFGSSFGSQRKDEMREKTL